MTDKSKLRVRITLDQQIFILNFSLSILSSQLGDAHANEIKHGIQPKY